MHADWAEIADAGSVFANAIGSRLKSTVTELCHRIEPKNNGLQQLPNPDPSVSLHFGPITILTDNASLQHQHLSTVGTVIEGGLIMRIFARAICATLLFVVPAAIQSQAPAADAPDQQAAAQQAGGKIVVYRPSALMGYGVACPFRYKGREIVELGRGKYAEWTVPAGTYILTNKTTSVEVNVAAGQTKYVRCQIKTGFMTGRADFQIVDEESFTEHSADYVKKEGAPIVTN